jgi:mannose-6-phosphate isomerase-like protein (cupin superfamily)
MTSAPDPRSPLAFAISQAETPLEGEDHPIHGDVTWHTLISADRQPSQSLVLGIAHLKPGGWLGLHRHDPAEFYLGLSGEATATVDGRNFRITSGIALFIPGNAEHGIRAGAEGCSFAYGFAVGSFADIEYRYTADGSRAE